MLLASLMVGCAHSGRNVQCLHDPPPEGWAQRCADDDFEGLVIFRQTDDIYRSGQPSPVHFQKLQKMGIRTVINVRRRHSDERIAETIGLNYYSIPIPPWDADEEHIVEFLKIASKPENRPLLVYCWYGGDRSNMLTASYRVAVEGWEKQEAIREMTEGGNYFHWFWGNLVDDIREMDVDRVRQLAGISPPAGSAMATRGRPSGEAP